jgi:hypothetical protein
VAACVTATVVPWGPPGNIGLVCARHAGELRVRIMGRLIPSSV